MCTLFGNGSPILHTSPTWCVVVLAKDAFMTVVLEVPPFIKYLYAYQILEISLPCGQNGCPLKAIEVVYQLFRNS
jgi:hypothetical protein